MARNRPYAQFSEVRAKIGLNEVCRKFGYDDTYFKKEGKGRWTGPCPLPSHPLPDGKAAQGHERNTDQFKVVYLRDEEDETRFEWKWFCHAADHKTGGDMFRFVAEMLGYDMTQERSEQDTKAIYNRVGEWFGREFADRLNTAKPKKQRQRQADEDDTKKQSPPPPASSDETTVTVPEPQPAAKAILPLKFALKLQPCEYLRQQRGISLETTKRYGVGLCAKGKFAGYCVFPLFRFPIEAEGECPVSYCGRYPADDIPEGYKRWKQYKDFPMKQYLFAINEAVADTADADPLIVVEGAVDVLMCYEQGIKGAVAPIGAYLSDDQIELLRQTNRSKLLLMFDGDDSGKATAKSVASLVAPHFWTRIITLPDGKDPADCREQLRDIVLPVIDDHSQCQVFTSSQDTLAEMAGKSWVKLSAQPIP
jgi:hypothetical protein